MTKLIRSTGKNSILVLAVCFVGYHIVATFFGMASFASLIQGGAQQKVNVESTNTEDSPQVFTEALADIEVGLNYNPRRWPTRISIEKVGIDLPLIGSMESQGSWEVSEDGANFAINTAIPNGEAGNTVLFGHDRPQLFHAIHELKQGDSIKVSTLNQRFTYKVTGFKVVAPSDVSVMDQTSGSTLTLITCDGWLSQERYIVLASFDSVETIS